MRKLFIEELTQGWQGSAQDGEICFPILNRGVTKLEANSQGGEQQEGAARREMWAGRALARLCVLPGQGLKSARRGCREVLVPTCPKPDALQGSSH